MPVPAEGIDPEIRPGSAGGQAAGPPSAGEVSARARSGHRRPGAPRTAVRLARSAALGYLLTMLLAAAFADSMIFFPPAPSYEADAPGLVMRETAAGDRVAVFHDAVPDAPVTVLFAHGNAEDIGDGRSHAARYAAAGVSVLAFDYPGYGRSSGRPTEGGAYAAADAVYDYAVGALGLEPASLVAHGRSLGGAVMVDLARRRPVGGLVIESSFVSAYRVVTRVPLLPVDQFRNLAKLPAVAAPVLVIHGRRDEVIAFWHGERLAAAVPEDRRSVLWVDGAGHNDLAAVAGEAYWEALASFTGSVARALRERDTGGP